MGVGHRSDMGGFDLAGTTDGDHCRAGDCLRHACRWTRGSFALITSGLLAYFLMHTHARRFLVRLAGQRLLDKMGVFFDRSGTWAIVLTRSLPYSIPEAMTLLAGLSRMPFEKFVIAMVLGSVPTAFVFAGVGAGWVDQPLLALTISYVLPVALLPVVLLTMRKSGE